MHFEDDFRTPLLHPVFFKKHVYNILREFVRTPISVNNYLPHVHLLVTLNRAKTLCRDNISATYL